MGRRRRNKHCKIRVRLSELPGGAAASLSATTTAFNGVETGTTALAALVAAETGTTTMAFLDSNSCFQAGTMAGLAVADVTGLAVGSTAVSLKLLPAAIGAAAGTALTTLIRFWGPIKTGIVSDDASLATGRVRKYD